MIPEKRRESRSGFAHQPQGTLQVLTRGRTRQVMEVIDVSPTGIRLRLGCGLAIGENVLIRCKGNGVDLKLNGTVIWNAGTPANPDNATDPASCVIGIQLASPSLLQAFWRAKS